MSVPPRVSNRGKPIVSPLGGRVLPEAMIRSAISRTSALARSRLRGSLVLDERLASPPPWSCRRDGV